VAILGNAAGTTARAIGHYFPQTTVDAVEIDPALTKVGHELFGLTGPRLRTHTADARPWLRASTRTYDVIMVDAYRQPYIPFYLATREFFALVRDHLAPGGLVVINVGHPEQSDQLEKVLTATMAAEFGADHVVRDPAEPTNSMLAGSTASDPAGRLRAAAGSLPTELADVATATADRLEPGLRGGRVFTDDLAPVEWLVDTSLVQVAE
jgi:spermidine synthase